MEVSILVLCLSVFGLIAILPKIFFRQDGSYNFKWLLTAAPYLVSPLFVVLHPQVQSLGAAGLVSLTISTILYFTSALLMGMTLGTHRVPLALWHQDNDAPKSIVTFGAYARIRHPFYSSFLLALMASVLIAPNWGTVLSLVYGFVAMSVTAGREEGRLSQSEFGQEYRDYMKKTGRFFPKFSRG